MELVVGKFVLLYLLLPVMGFILAGVMVIIAKKNQLLSNKKLIFYFLASCLVLALPALLGLIDYWFMPYAYIGLQALYLLLGWYNLKILKWLIPDINEKPYYIEFLFSFVAMFAGGALFSLVFNLCNELQYGIWASTCLLLFIFPTLFRKTCQSYIDIPQEIYKIWSYNSQAGEAAGDGSENIDADKIQVVEMELFKQVSDKEPLNIKAKTSEDMLFGTWFKLFVDDYNKKSAQSPIVYSDYENSYGWIFYTVSTVLGRKRYIDPDLSFSRNKMKEHRVVIAKRAHYEENEENQPIK